MAILARSHFPRGWVPDSDAASPASDCLLRMDNLIQDEHGVLSLRRGTVVAYTLPDADVHSLFTGYIGSSRYRMAGAGDAVYSNGALLTSAMAGSGDISFGSYLSQILYARSSSRWKYDGTTVRRWGIKEPTGQPTVAVLTADSKVLARWDFDEDFHSVPRGNEGGPELQYAESHDGVTDRAIVLNPLDIDGTGTVVRTLAGPTDFTIYDAGGIASDDDILELYVYVVNASSAWHLAVQIDVGAGDFETNYYQHTWHFVAPGPIYEFPPASGVWSRVQVRRGDMERQGGDGDWSTVRAMKLLVKSDPGFTPAASQWRFDQLKLLGSTGRTITGDDITYRWIAVYNTGTYIGKSAPSVASNPVSMRNEAADVTIAAADASDLDPQANEIWLFRSSTSLGGLYYRVAVQTLPFPDPLTIRDETSDASALSLDIRLEPYISVPPLDIIGIAGPHYDRILCLTATTVHMSQPINLDSFDTRFGIKVGDATETPYWIIKNNEELYVGTSKEIYRLEGDLTERPDEILNVIKRPLGTSNPPVNSAVTLLGDSIVYMAADGWRIIGGPVPLNSNDVDLLYRGYDRHGVTAVNLNTGRWKIAPGFGWLTGIAPERPSGPSSNVLHRYDFTNKRWYRHVYPFQFRSLWREIDGVLIAGTTDGRVVQLDTGTDDDMATIPVVLWTTVDSNGQPLQRKRAGDFRVRLNTGGDPATVAIHIEGSASSALNLVANTTGMNVVNTSLEQIPLAVQYQLRVTGSFDQFVWNDFGLSYVERPVPFQGRTLDLNAGTPGLKAVSGIRLRACTIGVPRTFTPILDDTLRPALARTVTTESDEPDDIYIPFTLDVADVAWTVDGPIELYEPGWQPVIDHVIPPGRRSLDTGPVDLGSRVAWVISLEVKTRMAAPVTVTPYIDDIPSVPQVISTPLGRTTTFTVSMARVVRGRQLRALLTSSADFNPYWIKWSYRLTGGDSDLNSRTIEVTS